jgi:hypothetical protein
MGQLKRDRKGFFLDLAHESARLEVSSRPTRFLESVPSAIPYVRLVDLVGFRIYSVRP